MPSRYLIYGLSDPRTGCLFYIGKSTQGLKRARSHTCPGVLSRDRTRKGNRLRSLAVLGLKPAIDVLETADDAEPLHEMERFWIACIRATGAVLLNHTDGGEGASGLLMSDSAKKKLRLANLGNSHAKGCVRSSETKALLSASKMGNVLTAEARLKISLSLTGRKQPADVVAKRALSNRGQKHRQFSAEVKMKMSASALARTDWRRVIDSNGTIYKNASEAARVLGFHPNRIQSALIGRRPFPAGHNLTYMGNK